jgi:hypothetical protein
MLLLLTACDTSDINILEKLTGIGEITTYEEICYKEGSGPIDDFLCEKNGEEPIITVNTFRVDYLNQRVVKSSVLNFAERYDNCEVFNSESWSCHYKSG